MITKFKLYENGVVSSELPIRAGDIVLVNADIGSIVLNEPCEVIDINLGSGSLGVKPLISILGVKLIQNYDVIKRITREELELYIQTNKYNI